MRNIVIGRSLDERIFTMQSISKKYSEEFKEYKKLGKKQKREGERKKESKT